MASGQLLLPVRRPQVFQLPKRLRLRNSSLLPGGQSSAARETEVRLRGAQFATTRTLHMCVHVPPVDNQIANVRNPGKSVGEDKDRISFVEQRVAQEQK